MTDNAPTPDSRSFLLTPNLSSGTSQIGFAAVGTSVTITSDAGPLWDFSIDNMHFNEALPTTIPTTVQPPPLTTTVNPPPVTLVYQGPPLPPPVVTLAEAQARETEGLDNQRRRGRGQGNNGKPLESRLEAQGLEPSPVPLPATLPLLAAAFSGVGLIRRRLS